MNLHRASMFAPRTLRFPMLRAALLAVPLSVSIACSEEEAPALGNAGESCAARRDCAAGLACVSNVCLDPKTGAGSPLGGPGESCEAKNDCGSGLACFAHVCVTASSGSVTSAKSCYKVECASKADCCEGFLPSPGCDKFKQDCDTDPAYCVTYRTFCECNRACQAELCVDTPPGCKSNAECTSLLTPYCSAGVCAECSEHADCKGENEKCIAGKCQPPCTQNEHCPLLSACQNGQCVDVGCATDKECFFLLKDPRAVCDGAKCQVPCSYDQECAEFQVCKDGTCTFVGCDSDEECRVYLGLEEQVGEVKAVCK